MAYRSLIAALAAASVLASASAFATGWSQNYPTPEPAPAKPEKKGKAGPATDKQAPAVTVAPSKGGATKLTVYNLCAPITLLVGFPMPPIKVQIDGQLVGVVDGCDVKTFSVKPGEREIRIVRTTEIDFGIMPGHKEVLPAGQTTFYRVKVGNYVEQYRVDPERAKGDIDVINKHKAGQPKAK